MRTRVVLADDHAVTRYGLRALLELSNMEVVGEAAEGREALRLTQDLEPDVAILDLSMPGLNGIDAAATIKARCPQTRIVILSMHSSTEHVHRALAAGASAYVLKGSASDEIVAAIRAVRAGNQYLSPELAALDRAPGTHGGEAGPLERLSARERQVLQLVVEGHSSAQIASLVYLSPKSVDTYRSRIMKKLGVSDLYALMKFAVEHGLTPGS